MLKGVFFCSRVHSGAVSKQTSKPTENTEHHQLWFHFARKNNANFHELKLWNEYPYPCITTYSDCVLKHRVP